MNATKVWTAADVYALGIRTDLETAAAIMGMGRTSAYARAQRGDFPVAVKRIGRLYVVPTAGLLHWLGLSERPAAAPVDVPEPRAAADAAESLS